MLSVVTWLWARDDRNRKYIAQDFRFTARHVNMLRDALERHLRVPHEVVCFTDSAAGLDPRIRPEPIWPDVGGHGRCWRRLQCFEPDFGRLVGPRYLSLDLDCVVLGDLGPLVERGDDLVLWRPRGLPQFNGSMWLHTPGTYGEVLEGFDPALSPLRLAELGIGGSDQAWLTHKLWGRVPTFGARDGVHRWRTECRPEPPDGARIVFFPGKLKPSNPRMVHSASWLVEHEHGRAWLDAQGRQLLAHRVSKLKRRRMLAQMARKQDAQTPPPAR